MAARPPQVTVPAPASTVTRPTVSRPTVTTPVTQPTVPKPTVPQPRVPQPMVTQPTVPRTVVPQQTVAQPRVTAEPRAVTTKGGGGILRQFGGGGGGVVVTRTETVAAPTVTITTETPVSVLSKLAPVWNGTDEQIRQLVELRYVDGTPVIDVKRRDIITEIIGMLLYQPFEDVVLFIRDAPNPEFVLWDQSAMDEGRRKVDREIAIQQAEEVGVKGVGKCRYCPSTELVFATKQLRAGDEAATVFVRCVMCQKQWRQ